MLWLYYTLTFNIIVTKSVKTNSWLKIIKIPFPFYGYMYISIKINISLANFVKLRFLGDIFWHYESHIYVNVKMVYSFSPSSVPSVATNTLSSANFFRSFFTCLAASLILGSSLPLTWRWSPRRRWTAMYAPPTACRGWLCKMITMSKTEEIDDYALLKRIKFWSIKKKLSWMFSDTSFVVFVLFENLSFKKKWWAILLMGFCKH